MHTNTSSSHLATVGAITSILGIAITPITQQMVSYPVRTVAARDGATAPAQGGTYAETWSTYDTITLERAIQSGCFALPDASVDPLPASCPTGRCTFPKYQSMAVCTKVADVSAALNVTRLPDNSTTDDWTMGSAMRPYVANGTAAWNASLVDGNGDFVIALATPMVHQFVLFAPLKLVGTNASLAFKEDKELAFTALANAFLIFPQTEIVNKTHPGFNTSRSYDRKFRALELLYHLCLNTYETSVTEGKSQTAVVSTSTMPFPAENGSALSPNWATSYAPCSRNPSELYKCGRPPNPLQPRYLSLGASQNFTMSLFAAMTYKRIMLNGLTGGYFTLGYPPVIVAGDGGVVDSVAAALYGMEFNITDPAVQMRRVQGWMDNVAMSLSNK